MTVDQILSGEKKNPERIYRAFIFLSFAAVRKYIYKPIPIEFALKNCKCVALDGNRSFLRKIRINPKQLRLTSLKMVIIKRNINATVNYIE